MASAGAHASALTTLDGIVNQQSAVLSFADTFWASDALVLVCLLLVLVLGKPPRDAKVALSH